MKRIWFYIIASFILISCFNSCYYDNMESLYPPALSNKCDTINVTYSGNIKPFLNTYCLSCHSNAAAIFAKNIKLENYADIVTNADKSLNAINWSPGVSPMPKGASSKLDNCSITQFRIWIKNGKPNN
jgi:hypothetical protein